MKDIQFSEKQYLGLNKMSFLEELLFQFFVFRFYWSENHDKSGDLFSFLGISILLISALSVFILHFETKVINNSIILDGLGQLEKVKIDINSLKSVEIVKAYSEFF